MGYSGAGLYDDDVGVDVRDGFRTLVADGLATDAVTDTLIHQWGGALDDHDEACAFWLALADSQWKAGRVEDRVRDNALKIIASGEDLARFEHDAKLHNRRRGVLASLSRQLATPPRSPVRLRRPFRSVSPVNVGDVFSFELSGDRLVFMRCVAISGDDRDNQPTVEVLDRAGPEFPAAPGSLHSRRGLAKWPDLLWLVRYPRDPDPTPKITILATGTQIDRQRTLPAQMVAWTEIEEAVHRTFGDA